MFSYLCFSKAIKRSTKINIVENWTKTTSGYEKIQNGVYMTVSHYDGKWNASVLCPVTFRYIEQPFKTRTYAIEWAEKKGFEIEL
jgi:hypothetical protein